MLSAARCKDINLAKRERAMKKSQKSWSHLRSVSVLSIALSLPVFANGEFQSKMVCNSGSVQKTGLSLVKQNQKNFLSGDQRTEAQKSMTHAQKVQKVLASIERVHAKYNIENKTGGYTKEQYANTIVWAADCTKSSLKWVAAIIGHESLFCGLRISGNPRGGDAGCGQWTPDGINEVKNQLRLRTKTANGSQFAHDYLHKTLRECYENYKGWVPGSGGGGSYQGYINVKSQPNGERTGDTFPRGTLREDYRHARAVDVDILSVAILLKVKAAHAGGYVVSGSAPGGIAAYNGGGVANYYKRVDGFRQKYLNTVNLSCMEDTYTSSVAQFACDLEIGEGHDECQANFEDLTQNRISIEI